MAVISSGDHEGPQPPEKQSVAAGMSYTSTTTGLLTWVSIRDHPILHAPPAQTRIHTPQPVHLLCSIVYPFAPGYGPPAMGTMACWGHTRRDGQPGERSQEELSIRTVAMLRGSPIHLGMPALRLIATQYPMGYTECNSPSHLSCSRSQTRAATMSMCGTGEGF
jgi:hypothetical protein